MEWKDFYWGTKKGPIPSILVLEIHRHAGVPKDLEDIKVEMDIPFHPLQVKILTSEKILKRKAGERERAIVWRIRSLIWMKIMMMPLPPRPNP